MMDTKEFNGTFWLSCLGIVTAFISGALVYAIKSKCIECNLCFGLISVKRDVNVELQEEKLEIENGVNLHENGQQHK
jgi:hypothetical protein